MCSVNQSLPVTSYISSLISRENFSNVVIVHINHLVKDILDFNQILHTLVSELIFIPVVYSPRIILPSAPYRIIDPRISQGPYREVSWVDSFSDNIRGSIRSIIQSMETRDKKVLLLEDGGYHFGVTKGNNNVFGQILIGSVEQTVSGAREAFKVSQKGMLQYPVLSIARARLKIRLENYFLAKIITRELSLLLYEMNQLLSLRDIIIIGYGILGRALAYRLREEGCHVKVFDVDSEQMHQASSDGFETTFLEPKDFNTSPLVVGVTGNPSFSLKHFLSFLESEAIDLYIVSASSKRSEFATLIKFFEEPDGYRSKLKESTPILRKVLDVIVEKKSWGRCYSFRYKHKQRRVLLIADGYPVNFYRVQSDSLPSRVADVTNAEMLSLAYHLVKNQNKLDNMLYLLGVDNIADLQYSEEVILRAWCFFNKISCEQVQNIMRPHPHERRLLLLQMEEKR